MAHLITGFKGEEHIQSADHGSFNAAIIGDEQYVLESGNEFEGSILDNNTVRIKDGDLLMYGRHVRINPDSYEDVTIETGTAGKNRIDLICMTYEKNTSDGKETAYLEVIKGEESAGAAVAPSATDGNILNGATKNQMLLYKVSINGVVLANITPLFDTITSMSELKKSVANGKEVVANAISGKGVQTATDASFATMATNISNIFTGIDTSDATATAGNILTGKTAYAKGAKVTGTMANKGGTTVTASAVTKDDSYTYLTIPSNGYYNTSSKVKTLNSNLATDLIISKQILFTTNNAVQISSYLYINTQKFSKFKIDNSDCAFKLYGNNRAKTITTNGIVNKEYDISDIDELELIIYKENAVGGVEYNVNNIRCYN